MKKKMLVITPISHINGLVKLLKKHFQLTILEDPSRKKVSQVIQKYEIIGKLNLDLSFALCFIQIRQQA